MAALFGFFACNNSHSISIVAAAWTNLALSAAQARIAQRIDRLSHGNAGDVKPVGAAVSELRIDYGPGYRVYFTKHGSLVILLLCGGDKRTQTKDIKRATAMAKELKV